jgi:hypothetical protein
MLPSPRRLACPLIVFAFAISGCSGEPAPAPVATPSPQTEPSSSVDSSDRPADAVPQAPVGEGPDRTPDRYYYSDEEGDYSTPADGDYDDNGRDDCQEQAKASGPDSVDWEYCD